MNCFPVFGTLSRHFRSLFRKVNQFTENPRHFPPISLCLSPSICIPSPFLVCFSQESAPVCREFEALSPGTKSDNRFCGYSACILRPSYQGKVHQFVANPRHFPPRYTHCAFSSFVSIGKVHQFAANRWHFPPISLRLPLSICIHSPFLVCFSQESAPVCREFEALSPGTKSDNRFCGYSACILRPSYQGKVHQFVANPRHFPPRYTHCAFSSFVSIGKVHQISTNPWHFPLENLIPGTEWSDNETCLETCHEDSTPKCNIQWPAGH